MDYKERFKRSDLTYTDIAFSLGTCEQTARRKINGKTKITKAEEKVLDEILKEKTHVRSERTESGI